MEAQSLVLIQDASRGVNLKIFNWALNANGFSLKAGDKLTVVIVLHQVTTPMGYSISVDSRNMVGANQWVIEAEVAKKKEEYLNNEELAKIFKDYRSKKVEFNIEVAKGSSPKAVALKIAMKLKATWVILDRKMENDEEYFLQKLSCGLSRLRRYDRIIHLRGRPGLHQEKQDNTRESITASIPASIPDSATDSEPDSVNQRDQERGWDQSNHHDEEGCSEPSFNYQTEKHKESRHDGGKRNQQLKLKLEESERYITCGGNNKRAQEQKAKSTRMYQKSEEFVCSGGAKNFYLARAEEYTVCENFFSLSDSFE